MSEDPRITEAREQQAFEDGLVKAGLARRPEPQPIKRDNVAIITNRGLLAKVSAEFAFATDDLRNETHEHKVRRQELEGADAARQEAIDTQRLKWVEMLQLLDDAVEHQIPIEAVRVAANFLAFGRVV